MTMTSPVVELQNVSKYFAKVIANKDVSLSINEGEIVALLGENGAGKSTIMKILYGLYGKDEGKILIDGKEADIRTPKDAMALGIAMIQQHFSLVNTHTATENIILGNVKGRIALSQYDEEIRKLALDYGFDFPVDKPVGQLAVGQQQKIEILKALYINARILIMDEPTAVLTPQEAEQLMGFIKAYAAKGNSVIFITHKLKEVMAVADRIVVMRNGVVINTVRKEETDEAQLAQMMIGHRIETSFNKEKFDDTGKKTVLELKDVTLQKKNEVPVVDHISFKVHEGEIFGIAGVSGNGQDEICELVSGTKKATGGQIIFNEEDVTGVSILERLKMGLGYVPVDRYRDGMIMDMNLMENVYLKHCFDKKWVNHGLIREKQLQDYTDELIKEHFVKATGYGDKAKSLSGGNQQKVVLGREVDIGSSLLMFNQPIRGLDMGAVDRIHKVILEEKDKGKAILLVSTELSEIFELCHRIAVMYKGRFMGIYENGELDASSIGLLMAGVDPHGEKESEA